MLASKRNLSSLFFSWSTRSLKDTSILWVILGVMWRCPLYFQVFYVWRVRNRNDRIPSAAETETSKSFIALIVLLKVNHRIFYNILLCTVLQKIFQEVLPNWYSQVPRNTAKPNSRIASHECEWSSEVNKWLWDTQRFCCFGGKVSV